MAAEGGSADTGDARDTTVRCCLNGEMKYREVRGIRLCPSTLEPRASRRYDRDPELWKGYKRCDDVVGALNIMKTEQ